MSDHFIARAQRLSGRNGQAYRTPLLIPSFSSRAFEFLKLPPAKDDPTALPVWQSDAVNALEVQIEQLNGAMLVSAYDIAHGHLGADVNDYLAKPEIVFIDSGGYETAPFIDQADQIVHPYKPKAWSRADYESVLRGLPAQPLNEIAIVNFDKDNHGVALPEQVREAQVFFRQWPHFMSVLLLKPPSGKFFDAHALEHPDFLASLRSFDVIGVTEKELGDPMIERLVTLAQFRSALDKAGLRSKPLHVFGSLDPLLSPLYFLAGAEIFDGLSWLKYGYRSGVAAYWATWAALEGLEAGERPTRVKMASSNLKTLAPLRSDLETMANRKTFEGLRALSDIAEVLKLWHGRLTSRLSGGQ